MREKNIRFVLKAIENGKDNLAVPVYLKYACKDAVMIYSTGQKCLPKRFHKNDYHSALDAQIDKLKGAARKFISDKENAGKDVLSVDLYNHLATVDNKPLKGVPAIKEIPRYKYDLPSKPDNNFFSAIQEWIDKGENKKLNIVNSGKKNGHVYSKGTIRHWKLTKGILQKFDPNMTWEKISMDTYNNFIEWCNQPEQNFRPLYTGSLIKIWKVFMNRGLMYKLHSNNVHLNKGFSKPTENSYENKVYLNEDEIEQIKAVKLTGVKKEIRDFYVFHIYTGLRIGDAKALTMEDVDMRNKIITITNKKTGKKTSVPLSKYNQGLIKEYKGLPRAFHENTVNEVIKAVARTAGIDEVIRYNQIKGGQVEQVRKFKWELVCCHTARRSFITNGLKYMSAQQVMGMTGQTLPVIAIYNRMSVEDNAKNCKAVAYFN